VLICSRKEEEDAIDEREPVMMVTDSELASAEAAFGVVS